MNAVEIMLRPMSLDDLERVQEIDRLSFSLPWPKSSFQFELKESLVSRCWVAESEGQVVGMIVTWLIMEEAHIATFAVHPDWRGLGIGRRLLVQALAEAKQKSCEYAALEVRAGNEAALRLYAEFGFVETGRREGYYHDTHEDAILMEAPIP